MTSQLGLCRSCNRFGSLRQNDQLAMGPDIGVVKRYGKPENLLVEIAWIMFTARACIGPDELRKDVAIKNCRKIPCRQVAS